MRTAEPGERQVRGLVALGAAAVLIAGCSNDLDRGTVSGTVNGVDVHGVGISVGDEGFAIGNGVQWVDVDGTLRGTGQPECLPPMSLGAQVSLDVVDVRPGGPVVLQVRCESLPTELFGGGETSESPYAAYCQRLAGQEPPLRDLATNPCE